MESLNEALIACVKACGGSHQVGRLLWPEKSQESAQRTLLDCLNDERPAKLSPEQVMLVLRLARNQEGEMSYLPVLDSRMDKSIQ